MLKSSMKIVAACERSRCVLSIARNSVRAASNTSSSLSGSKDKTNQQQQSEIIRPEFGLMFDIDGVLVRGKTLLPQTKNCIRLITDEHGNFRVPTVFVTNAGNELRSTKAAKLSNFLGVYIDPNQVVMSHSPLKLFKQYHNMRCLVSGQGPIVEIAKNLGFKSLITIDDLRQHYPHLDVVDHKRRNFAPCALGRYFPPIEAIVLFGESIRWETNLQLIIDVLMSSGKLDHSTPLPSLTNLIMSAQTPPVGGGEHQNTFPVEQLPILACNADMVWMAEAAMPRFGHGVFLHCLEQIYAKLSGRELKYQCIVGKPNEITYYYAEQMVQRHAASIGLTNKVRRLYAVGDNLDTDIYGANVYNQILENNRRSREKKQFQQQKQQQQQEAEQEHHQQQAILSGSSSSYATTSQSSSKSSSKSYDMSEQESAVSQQRRYSTSSSGNGNNSSTSEHHHRYMDSRDVVTSHVSDAESIRSILVRTGVFRGAADSTPTADSSLAHKDMLIDQSLMKPSYISDNVFEAVKLVYELENFS